MAPLDPTSARPSAVGLGTLAGNSPSGRPATVVALDGAVPVAQGEAVPEGAKSSPLPSPSETSADTPSAREQLRRTFSVVVSRAFDKDGDLLPAWWARLITKSYGNIPSLNVEQAMDGEQAAYEQLGRVQIESELNAAIAARFPKLTGGERQDRVATMLGHVKSKIKTDDIGGLARAFYDKTLGQPGTNEEFVYCTCQAAFAYGKIKELNAELTQLLALQGVRVANDGKDSAIRYVINDEMQGSERQRALDFLEVGYDRMSSTDWAYRREGLVQVFDEIGTAFWETPVEAAAADGAATTVLTVATAEYPPVGVAVTVGFLAYGTGRVIKNEVQAEFFSASRAERIEHLRNSGAGIGFVVLSAPSALRAGNAVRISIQPK